MGEMFLLGDSEYEQYQFKDEENDFHSFVEKHLPKILDVEPEHLCVLHEYHNRDFVCVDSEGRVYVIECKLGRNPNSRREVLSQVLDYVHGTHNIVDPDGDTGQDGQTITEYFESKIEGFDTGKFQKQLRKNVQKRATNIYIVSDDLHDRLITSALNTFVGQRKVPVKVVEAKKFVSETEELAYIRTINDGRKETTSLNVFDAQDYLTGIKNEERRQFCKDIIDHFRDNYTNGEFDITDSGTARFSIEVQDEHYTIFGLKRDGTYWQSVQQYLNLDSSTLLSYYENFREDLELDGFDPKESIGESACYRVISKNPEALDRDVLFEKIEDLIRKVKNAE